MILNFETELYITHCSSYKESDRLLHVQMYKSECTKSRGSRALVGLVGPKYFDVGLVGSCLRGSRGSKLFLRGSEINLRGSEIVLRGSEIILRGSEIYLRGSNSFTWVREKLVSQNFP